MVMIVMPPASPAPMAPCAKRNPKGLLCRGRQLKVCDPTNHRNDNHKHNNNKKQQQQKKTQQPQQNSQLACAASSDAAASSVVNSNSPTVKRPHEEVEEADGEPQGSAIKRSRIIIDIQLPQYSNQADDRAKSQSADDDDVLGSAACPPPLNPSTFAAIKKKRSHEAATCADDDDESQQASAAIKRPRISHVLKLLRSAPSESDYVEPYSPTSPGFVWPQNTRNKVQVQVQVQEEEGLYAHEESQQQQMKRPTIIDHIDLASALGSCAAATGGDDEVLVTDQGFINDLLNLSSLLLRSACI